MSRRDTLLLSILTLITALAWIAFDIYHASVDTTISPETEAQLAPITPRFDKAIIEDVKNRENVNPVVTQSIIRRVSPTPTLRPASPSAVTKTATQSGGL